MAATEPQRGKTSAVHNGTIWNHKNIELMSQLTVHGGLLFPY